MMSVVSEQLGNKPDRPFLSAVTSLNTQRRDDALYLLGKESGKPLTPYDICKTVVLADVFHVIQFGRPIFGGELRALPFGPVESRTLSACKRWAAGLMIASMMGLTELEAKLGDQPLRPSGWTGAKNHIPEFTASPDYGRKTEADWDWFSDDEHQSILRAFKQVKGMKWNESQRYFHEPVSAIGYAYDLATKPFPKPFTSSVAMNWFDVLDGAETIDKLDVSYARAMLGLWI